MLKKSLYIFLFICFLFSHGYSDFRVKPLQPHTSHTTSECIFQDNKGFMWFGTMGGLNRFDGNEIHTFLSNPADSSSLTSNRIRKIAQDFDGNLWIATEKGLNRYNYTQNTFTQFWPTGSSNSLPSSSISDVLVDDNGTLWVAANNLCRYIPESNSFKNYPVQSHPDNNDHYHNLIFKDKENNIWYGTRRQIYRINSQNDSLELVFDGTQNALGGEFWHFHEMAQKRDGSFWLATNLAGLYKATFENGHFNISQFPDHLGGNEYLSQYRLLTLFFDNKDNLWLSCENKGLLVFDKNLHLAERLSHNKYDKFSLNGNSIWSIFQDKNNRIWLGSWMAGIAYIDPLENQFQHFSSELNSDLSSNIITGFIKDEHGNIWIGTDGGGLNYFNRSNDSFTVYKNNPNDQNSLSSNAVLSLCFDDNGQLWVGTYNGGINILNLPEKSFTRINTANSPLKSNNIFDLLNDGNGHIYVSTWEGGLAIYDMSSKTWSTFTAGVDKNYLPGNNIFVFYKDDDGTIWIGTDTAGLCRVKANSSFPPTFDRVLPDKLNNNFIHTLVRDQHKNMWVGTANGLKKLEHQNGLYETISRHNILTNNYITGLFIDQKNRLWASTLNDILNFDGDKITRFNAIDDMQNVQFIRNATYMTTSGEIFIGGTNGFNSFHPDSIKNNPLVPPVHITDIKIFNQSIPIEPNGILTKNIMDSDSITLSYKASMITLEFVALNYIHSNKNQYAYKLEGFDSDWNFTNGQNPATYTNLDHGKYRFKVKASNNDGLWNETGATLFIKITPPLWKTSWAYIFYIFSAAGLFGFIMHFRLKQQQLKHELELEHVELEKLYEIDKMKSRFFVNMAHEFKTPIMLIAGPLQSLIKKTRNSKERETLNIVQRNANRVVQLLNQMVNFSRSDIPDMDLHVEKKDIVAFVKDVFLSFKKYAQERNISFDFESEKDSIITWFDPEKMDKIIYNLLSNAFKYTPDGGQIDLSLAYQLVSGENLFHIIIKDTGQGISLDEQSKIFDRYYKAGQSSFADEASFGVGLHLTKELVELHNGEISVKSEPGKGTTFTITLILNTVELSDTSINTDSAQTIQNDQIESPKQSPSLILVVDDEKDVHHYLNELLGQTHQLVFAQNGKDGFEQAKTLVPDLVITDVHMPVFDGLKMTEKLKTDPQTSHIPVLMFSVQDEIENRIKGLSLGADDYLPKPFNENELKIRVRNLIESRKELRKHYLELASNPKDESHKSLDDEFILKIRQIVQNNLEDTSLDAAKICHELGASRTQLYRKLKSLTGQSVHQFVREMRLQQAKQLLEKRKMNITEIAYHVGFNDLNYFSRCFRKSFGLSPSEYLSSL